MYKPNDEFIMTDDLQMLRIHAFTTESETIAKGVIGKVKSVSGNFITFEACGSEYTLGINYFQKYTKPYSPNRFSEVLTENLDFAAAMNYLFGGNKVARKVWGGYWKIGNIYADGELGAEYKKAIVAHLKDGGWSVATPYQDDMLATDWMVVR